MQRPQILIAEDDQTTAKQLESRLKALRYDVSGVVSSSAEAVRAAARDHPDLILMDLRLNCRLEGVPAGRKIRDDLGIPVVYVAERREAAPGRRRRVPRPFGLLRKPFEDSALLAVIETTLARYKVQKHLRRSHRRYRLLYERSPAVHVLVGRDGAIRDLNRAAAHVLGYRKDEILGRHVLDFVLPEHGRALLELLSRGFRGEAVGEVEIQVRAADGSVRTILVTPGRFVLGSRNDPTAPITGIDITERRRAERQAAEQQEQLEHARRFQSLADLAGGFAHHFNNLLTIIQGNAQLLRSGRDDPRDADEILGEIIGAAERAAELTRRLLGFAQRAPHEPRPVDLHAAVQAAAQMLRPGLDAAVRARLDLRSASTTVRDDAALLDGDRAPAGGGRVMVVDDEPAVRELAARVLRGAGFAVEAFAEGAGAVDYFTRHHRQVGLVLLDMVMPDLDGREVLLRMRQIDPEVRAVLCSGCDHACGVRPGGGFAGLLPKPFDIRQLLQTVSRLLRP